MRHAYRLPWVIVMLGALDGCAGGAMLLARRVKRGAVRVARRLCRSPDEQWPSLICQRIRRTRL